jgi:hypothetical protein
LRTIAYRLLLVVSLISVQYLVISSFDYSFDSAMTTTNVAQNSSIKEESTNIVKDTNTIQKPKDIVAKKETPKVEKPKEPKPIKVVKKEQTPKPTTAIEQKVPIQTNTVVKVEDKPIQTVVKSDTNQNQDTTTQIPVISDRTPVDVNSTDTLVVEQNIQVEESKKIGKILTLAVSLIRSTPVLDKTKANAVDYKPKDMVLEYEKELDEWYYLGNDQYIHKSVVKKLP